MFAKFHYSACLAVDIDATRRKFLSKNKQGRFWAKILGAVPFLPFPSPSLPSPPSLALEVGPLNTVRGLGSA